MDNYISLFSNVLHDVRYKILEDIYYLENFDKGDSNFDVKKEMLNRRLEYLDETTVKYILSNAKACLHGSITGADFLKSYGVKPIKFNEFYDLRFLEKYLNEVFFKLQCPGILPSVDDINSDLSFFGFSSSDSKKFSSLYSSLKRCDGPLFYEMYQTGLDNGLSNREIFEYFSRIFKALEYYNYSYIGSDILCYVPYLDIEIDDHFKSFGENFSLSKK